MKRKRYRYISCGTVDIEDPINFYRLVASNRLPTKYAGRRLLRVEIPDDIALEVEKLCEYSTTDSNMALKNLSPIWMMFDAVEGKWLHQEEAFTEEQYNEIFQKWNKSLYEKVEEVN